MENVYTSFEFTKFTNFSQKHGWLSKRSNGVTNILKRKRYFVLTKTALYWFKQDKSRFLLKGVLSREEGEWLGYNDKCVNLKSIASGKTYILSGKNIVTWVDLIQGVFEAPIRTRRSSAGTNKKKQPRQSLRSFQTCPDVFRSDSNKISEASSRSSASGHLSVASSTNSGPSSVLSDRDEDEEEVLGSEESVKWYDPVPESIAEGFGEPILPEPRLEEHLNTIRDAIDEQTMREFHQNLDEQFMRGRVISVTSPAPDCVDHLVFEPNSPSHEEEEDGDESESGSSSFTSRHKKAPSVRNAVAFFEGLNEQCAMPKKRKRARKLSNRRRQIYGDSSASMSHSVESSRKVSIAKSRHSDSFGGASFDSELDLEEINEANYSQFKLNFRYDDSSDTLLPHEDDDDTSSLCSEYSSHEAFGEDNKGARSLSSMASNLSEMVDQLNFVCSTLERQTKHNLDFLSGTPPVDPNDDFSTQSSIHSDDLMTMEPFHYPTSDEEVGSPLVESPPLCTDDLFPEWHADIYQFIESHVLDNKPLTAIDLSKQFAEKNLSIKTLKAMYQRVRENVQRDRRILRRQNSSLSLCSVTRFRENTPYERDRGDTIYEIAGSDLFD